MGSRDDYAIYGMIFAFFGSSSGVLDCGWRINFFKDGDGFFFNVVTCRFSCKAMCTITTKQHSCRFLVLKRNIQNVRAGFALFAVVKIRCSVG